MTKRLNHTHPAHLHQEMWELLPWYVNCTLSREEDAEVEAHLATCPACQVELTRCREISTAVHDVERQDAWSPSPEHCREILAQIDTPEAHEAPNRSRWARLRAHLVRQWMWLQETPLPVRWALAFQGALVLVLATALVWQSAPLSPHYYQTLSSEEKSVPADRAQVRVIFAEDITEKEIRSLLTSLGATLTQGPSKVGVYTVALSSAPKDLKSVLARLRARPKVRLAEPVSPEPVP